jgi:hypothetical protein
MYVMDLLVLIQLALPRFENNPGETEEISGMVCQ